MLILECPHCNETIIVLENEINCGIFRHAIYKNWSQFPPHAPKSECDKAKENDYIYGCGKPLKYDQDSKKFIVCDYI